MKVNLAKLGRGFNIKVDKKHGENNQFLTGVIIHEKNPSKPNGNYIVTIAQTGEFKSKEGSNTLSLILNDGSRYEDIQEKDIKKQKRNAFCKNRL